MSDNRETVKLVIEIPKISYDATLDMGRLSVISDNDIYNMIANGTPLSEVLAEIKGEIENTVERKIVTAMDIYKIMDKHIGKAEKGGEE